MHSRVIIDSRKLTRITDENPQRTLASSRETTVTNSLKKTSTTTGGGTFTVTTASQNLPLPNVIFGTAGSCAKADEEGITSGITQFNSRITQQEGNGAIWWGFDFQDANLQDGGVVLLKEIDLPTVTFRPFLGERGGLKKQPVPDRIDVEIQSYWSIIPRTSDPGWMARILQSSNITSNNSHPVPQYSHLCQINFLQIPSGLRHNSDYCATVYVENSGRRFHLHPEILRPGDESVKAGTKMARSMEPFDYGKY